MIDGLHGCDSFHEVEKGKKKEGLEKMIFEIKTHTP